MNKEMQERMEKQYREALKNNIERAKKEEKKNKILYIFVILFVIIVTCLFILLDSKMTNKAVENCIKKGNTQNYCIEKLG